MNDTQKLYLLHDFTEYVIEHGNRSVTEDTIHEFVTDITEGVPCYLLDTELSKCVEVEDYLGEIFRIEVK